MTDSLNADFAQRVVLDTAAMDWQPSPSPTVWRKRLDLAGAAEAGRVTSVVRYDPGSSFHAHDHPNGEEILVLDGVFSDEHGDWPAGTYLLNPEGFRHAPFSKEGCVLFVKLQQYGGPDRTHLVVATMTAPWQPSAMAGIEVLALYDHPDHAEQVALVRFAPGASYPRHEHPGGEEIFVLDGSLEDEHGQYGTGTWLRQPPGSTHSPHSSGGCTLYVKSGHLAEQI